jgi:zinc D-Ala-D-Ala carboxypeptidase
MTKNFSANELRCKCGCGMLPRLASVERLQRVRDRFMRPMPLSSAARCSRHNQRVSKSGPNGPHTTGRAFDVAISGVHAVRLLQIALEEGFTGIGVKQTGTGRFLHLDDIEGGSHPRPNLWSY